MKLFKLTIILAILAFSGCATAYVSSWHQDDQGTRYYEVCGRGQKDLIKQYCTDPLVVGGFSRATGRQTITQGMRTLSGTPLYVHAQYESCSRFKCSGF